MSGIYQQVNDRGSFRRRDLRGEFVDSNVFYEIGPGSWRWRKDRSWDGGESWLEGVGFIDCRAP